MYIHYLGGLQYVQELAAMAVGFMSFMRSGL